MNSFLRPFKDSLIIKALLATFFFLFTLISNAQVNEIPKYNASDVSLHEQIVKMDSIYFTAYNTCDIKTQASLYADNIEFFHDKGGL